MNMNIINNCYEVVGKKEINDIYKLEKFLLNNKNFAIEIDINNLYIFDELKDNSYTLANDNYKNEIQSGLKGALYYDTYEKCIVLEI